MGRVVIGGGGGGEGVSRFGNDHSAYREVIIDDFSQ